MTFALPKFVRKIQIGFPWAQGHLQVALETGHTGFYQFSSGVTIWPQYLVTHLMTHEVSNFCSEKYTSQFRRNTRKMVWFRRVFTEIFANDLVPTTYLQFVELLIVSCLSHCVSSAHTKIMLSKKLKLQVTPIVL